MLNVAILGASESPQRIAFQAQRMLVENHHRVFPVSLRGDTVNGITAFRRLQDIPQPLDVVTIYLRAARLPAVVDDILAARPGRVIFNPGTESPQIATRLQQAGIATEEACTLVLLRTGQFD